MPLEQMVLSKELMQVMRRAVQYAVEADSEFVQAPHILMGLLDDEVLGPTLSALIPRERVAGAPPRRKSPPYVVDVDAKRSPFPIYQSLVIRTPDGKEGKWLDAEAYEIFLDGARRVDAGPYLPKHLAKAYVSESNRDRALLEILGSQPADVANAVFSL